MTGPVDPGQSGASGRASQERALLRWGAPFIRSTRDVAALGVGRCIGWRWGEQEQHGGGQRGLKVARSHMEGLDGMARPMQDPVSGCDRGMRTTSMDTASRHGTAGVFCDFWG